MDRIFALVDKYCFQGHTHVPGVFTESLQDDSYQFQSPEELTDSTHKLDERKTLINVGSVGQPRDGDWRACYVLLDGKNVTFRRVDYDIATTIQKIHDIPDLDNFLGDRLRDGAKSTKPAGEVLRTCAGTPQVRSTSPAGLPINGRLSPFFRASLS